MTVNLAPFDTGGPASVGSGLLRQFLNIRGLEVTLIVGGSATNEQIVSIFGDRFKNIIRVSLERSMRSYICGTLQNTKKVWKGLKYVDVVHVNVLYPLRNFYLPFFALIQKKPISYTIHAVGDLYLHGVFYGEKGRNIKVSALQIVTDLLQPLWTKIVVNAQFVKAVLSKKLDEKKLCLIPNGIDYDAITEAPILDLDGEIKLLFVGKLRYVKGFDLLLKALAMLDENVKDKIKLYVAGSGVQEREYQLLAKSLGVNRCVQFLGALPLNECFSLYKSCDILVMPSRFESFPMTLIEALGSGTPIVATTVGGIPEIVKNDRNGFLVEPNPQEIMQKVKFLIDHPEVRERMSKNNLADAKRYLWQDIAKRYLEVFKSML